MVVPVVMVSGRRGRRMVVMSVARMVHWRRRVVGVVSAVRCREAGSREGQAGKDRSEGFEGLVVHITPSLSFWIVVRISRLHSVRYVNEGFLTNFFHRILSPDALIGAMCYNMPLKEG